MNAHENGVSVRTGLHELLTTFSEDARKDVFVRDGTLHILFAENSSFVGIEKEIRKVFPFILPRLGIRRLGAFIVALLFGALSLGVLTVVGVFGDVVSDISRQLEFVERFDAVVLVLSLFLGSIFIGFVPQALLGPEDGTIKSLLLKWVNDDLRLTARIRRRLNRALRRKAFSRIVVWNAAAGVEFDKEIFIGMLERLDCPIEMRIHHDEGDYFVGVLKKLLDGRDVEFQSGDGAGPAPAPAAAGDGGAESGPICRADADPIAILQRISGSRSTAGILFLLAFSSRRACEPWSRALAQSFPNEVLVSDVLAGQVFERNRTGAGVRGDGQLRFDTMIRRAERDYRILEYDELSGKRILSDVFNWERIEGDHNDEIHSIRGSYPARTSEVLQDTDDPLSLFLILVVYGVGEWPRSEFSNLLSKYIQASEKYGSYPGLSAIAILLGDAFNRDCDYTASASVQTEMRHALLRTINLDKILLLGRNFEEIGEFDAAFWVYNSTRKFHGPTGTIRLARLYERIGKPGQGIEALNGVSRLAERLIERYELSILDPRVAPLSNGEIDVLIEYCQQRAWITLSCRLNDKEDNLKSAEKLLRISGRLIGSLCETHLSSLVIWRQNNYLAIVEEWKDDFGAAAEMHKETALIPGVSVKWRYASWINAGITLRRATVGGWDDTIPEAPNEEINKLKDALNYLRQGYEGKKSLVDLDEAPIYLHNSAVTNIFIFLLEVTNGRFDEKLLLDSMRLIEYGLKILYAKGSEKKRHLMLEEGALVLSLLDEYKLSGEDEWAVFKEKQGDRNRKALSVEEQTVLAELSRFREIVARGARND